MSSRASDENGSLYVITSHRYMGDITREWLDNASDLREAKMRHESRDNWGSTKVRRATWEDVERLRSKR